ncbi:MAG TPA: PAS domain S-box protein [Bryobacteraceae bacterium]|jgi:PAS domain S-box-containing protein|nr:PAS domain S-box protein [Bryobacteraceae bacterium]
MRNIFGRTADDTVQSYALRYGVAIAAVAAATGVRLLLDPELGNLSPFPVFFFAIILTARYCGLLPALSGTFISIFAADYFLVEPRGSFGFHGNAQFFDLAVYLGVSIALAIVGSRMYSAAQRQSRQLRETSDTLAEAEEKLGLMLKSTGVSVWNLDLVRDSISADENAAAQLGIPLEKFPRNIEEFAASVHPDDRERVQHEVAAALQQGAPYDTRFRTIRPDGTVRCLATRGKVYRDSNGRPVQFTGFCTDVTDQWQTEENLRGALQRVAAEARFRELLEAAPQAVLVTNSAGKIVVVNAQAETLFGYQRQEMLGQTIELLVPQRFQEPHAAHRREYQRDPYKRRKNTGLDLYARRKDGTELPVEISLSPLETEEGELVYSTIQDITERRNAERSREELAAIVDYSDDAIIRKSLEGAILNWNAGAERLYGYTTQEALGKPISMLMPSLGCQEWPRIKAKLQQGEVVRQETVRRRKDGALIDVALTVSPIRNLAGEVMAASAIARDISQRKKTEQEILKLNGRLEQTAAKAEAANLAKSTFLSTMSHEIRTPMNAILGYAQLMERDSSLGPEAKANLKIIGRSGEHLLALINDVLDMSKIEAGRVELHPLTFHLGRLLNDLAAMFRLRAEAKGLQFELVTGGEQTPYVVADEGKTRQILINLLGNAVKFTRSGKIVLRVELESREGKLWMAAAIADSGPGMTEEEQSRLFEPFCQPTRDLNTQQGTGLGLAISRKYARLMGGDIAVASTAGEGSTFLLEVPVGRGDGAVANRQVATGRVVRVHGEPEFWRILVVDDRPENRGWLVKLLASVGFSVREAGNGASGIQVWEEWRPQLILMDVHMPVMDGLEATRRIKASAQAGETVVIALTASAMQEDRTSVRQSGADDFLAKPCGEEELLEKIAVHLHVAYEYAPTAAEEQPATLSAESLREFPAAMVQQMRDATLSGNRRMLNRLIGEMRRSEDAGPAQALQELVDRCEYDALMELLEAGCQR